MCEYCLFRAVKRVCCLFNDWDEDKEYIYKDEDLKDLRHDPAEYNVDLQPYHKPNSNTV